MNYDVLHISKGCVFLYRKIIHYTEISREIFVFSIRLVIWTLQQISQWLHLNEHNSFIFVHTLQDLIQRIYNKAGIRDRGYSKSILQRVWSCDICKYIAFDWIIQISCILSSISFSLFHRYICHIRFLNFSTCL